MRGRYQLQQAQKLFCWLVLFISFNAMSMARCSYRADKALG